MSGSQAWPFHFNASSLSTLFVWSKRLFMYVNIPWNKTHSFSIFFKFYFHFLFVQCGTPGRAALGSDSHLPCRRFQGLLVAVVRRFRLNTLNSLFGAQMLDFCCLFHVCINNHICSEILGESSDDIQSSNSRTFMRLYEQETSLWLQRPSI